MTKEFLVLMLFNSYLGVLLYCIALKNEQARLKGVDWVASHSLHFSKFGEAKSDKY